MKCKRHPQGHGGGVCASCLRDRLLALQVAQNGTLPDSQRRNPPPPVLFPRSASPLASHRRSVDSDNASDPGPRRRRRLFHQTPQIGDRRSDGGKANGCHRLHLFFSLFHHHHHHSDESEATASNSWFWSLIHGRTSRTRKKATTVSSRPPVRTTKSFAVSDRGMSPVRCHETDDNASDSGYSTESSATWRRPTPARRASAERHRRNGGGLVGFTVCLSPLVRPGRSSRRSQPPDAGFSAELRSKGDPPINRHASFAGGSLGPNRSRKLADRGRFR